MIEAESAGMDDTTGKTDREEQVEQPDAAESTKVQADVQVEETGPCTRLVKIEVPQAEVQKQIDDSYDELHKSAFIKGFRTGHVPRHVLEMRFGDEVLGSVKETLVGDTFRNAIEDNHLTLALAPDIDDEAITLDPTKPLAFQVVVEVIPEFTIDNYKGLQVERPAVQVTDADIDRALESFRHRHGTHATLDEGQVADADIPICHAAVLQGDDEIWSQQEIGVGMAAGSLGGMAFEGIADALRGANVGDTRTLEATLPDNFPVEDHRGQPATLEITIDQIRRFQMPDATDEWAQTLDFESLDDLREELEDELHQRHQADADHAVQDQIADRLLELTDFTVPDGLIDHLVDDQKSRIRSQLMYSGVAEEDLDKLVDQRAADSRDAAVRTTKLNFIYRQIAEQEKIFVTEDELTQRVQAIALNYRRSADEVYAELEERGQIDGLRRQMREERARDFLVEQAEVADAAAPPAADAPAEDKPKAKAKKKAKPKADAEAPADDDPPADE